MSESFLRFIAAGAFGYLASSAWRLERHGDFLVCCLGIGAILALVLMA